MQPWLQSELKRTLESQDLSKFTEYVEIANEAEVDLNMPYGKDSGFKTILHLALEEEDGEPYIEALLKVSPLSKKSVERVTTQKAKNDSGIRIIGQQSLHTYACACHADKRWNH